MRAHINKQAIVYFSLFHAVIDAIEKPNIAQCTDSISFRFRKE